MSTHPERLPILPIRNVRRNNHTNGLADFLVGGLPVVNKALDLHGHVVGAGVFPEKLDKVSLRIDQVRDDGVIDQVVVLGVVRFGKVDSEEPGDLLDLVLCAGEAQEPRVELKA